VVFGECMRANDSNLSTGEGISDKGLSRLGCVPPALMLGRNAVCDLNNPVSVRRPFETTSSDANVRATMHQRKAEHPRVNPCHVVNQSKPMRGHLRFLLLAHRRDLGPNILNCLGNELQISCFHAKWWHTSTKIAKLLDLQSRLCTHLPPLN